MAIKLCYYINMTIDLKNKIKVLKDYFLKRPEVEMAFLFGSRAKGRETVESDIDIAVYFKPKTGRLEWEEKGEYENENQIWNEVEDILGITTDFVALNRAPSTLAFEILRTGTEIVVKNYFLYFKFLTLVSSEAIDFINTTKDYWLIKERSFSLTELDKQRLMKLVDFMEKELAEATGFKNDLDWKTYQHNSKERRNAERWVENIVNSSIDMAKILLASEKKKIADTYRDMLESLRLLAEFDPNMALKLGENTRIRNILAHEYLDIRFDRIRKFIDDAQPAYQYFLDFAKNILKNPE